MESTNQKLVDDRGLLERRDAWRGTGKRIVFTNGTFDLLHSGHVRYLHAARELGDVLIVGLNSDASVRNYKGPLRPIVPEAERAEVLAALESVDAITIFDDATAERLVDLVKPDIYVKGGDWGQGNRVPPEVTIAEAHGGRAVYIPFVEGNSTTTLIERIVERYCNNG